jgi:hypothetical protein
MRPPSTAPLSLPQLTQRRAKGAVGITPRHEEAHGEDARHNDLFVPDRLVRCWRRRRS